MWAAGSNSCVRRGVSISKKCKKRIKWTGEEFTLMANSQPHINPEPRTEPPSHINLQLKLERQSSQVRQSSLESKRSQVLEGQSGLQGQCSALLAEEKKGFQ